MLEHGRTILPVEVKMTQKPNITDAGNLLAFLEEHPLATRGVLVHGGNDVVHIHSKVIAVPWWWLDR